jgi:DNA-binding winged helix-turn-helix (wHTH) protein
MSNAVARRKFLFGEYELLPERRLLRRNGQDVELAAKAFDTLVFLVERSPGLVTKEELMSALWPNTVVAENSLSSQIWTLRKTLGDGRWVENVPRRGYQFVGEFQLQPDEPDDLARPPAPPPTLNTPKSWNPVWLLCGLLILLPLGYLWRRAATHTEHPPTEPFVSQYIRTIPFTSDGFSQEEQFVADAITHNIRSRLVENTKSWPEKTLQRWSHTLRTGHVRKQNGRILVDVQLLNSGKQVIWADSYSQPYPLAETVIGDVIGEHLVRLFEQGERRATAGNRVFDAVRDFSLNPNPQSSWSYGQVRDWTGVGFRRFAQVFHTDPEPSCWSAGVDTPDQGVVCHSTRIFDWQTMMLPPDALLMSTGSQFTTLRWVAPADGHYSVEGRIRVADAVGRPSRVRLLHNTLDILIERRNFAGFGSTIPVNLPALQFTQGSALDLIFGPEIGVDYMSIDVQLTIKPFPPH